MGIKETVTALEAKISRLEQIIDSKNCELESLSVQKDEILLKWSQSKEDANKAREELDSERKAGRENLKGKESELTNQLDEVRANESRLTEKIRSLDSELLTANKTVDQL